MTNSTSANGLALIQQYEGFRSQPVRLPDGNWLVGYSHVRIGEPGQAVNENEALDLLTLDVAAYEKLVNARVTQPLNQAQFDALVSFAFSVGAEAFEQSQVLRRVNAGDFVAAACAIDAWRKADVGGEVVVVDSLVRRRAAEKALFLRDMTVDATSSVFMRAKLDYAASILGAPVKSAAPEARPAPALHIVPAAPVEIAAEPAAPQTPAQRLTEILKSEPATEALLLTQVVANDVEEDEGEIVTAHAKPVARPMDNVREATRVAFEAAEAKRRQRKRFFFFDAPELSNSFAAPAMEVQVDRRLRAMRAMGDRPQPPALPNWAPSAENIGLVLLLVFGLGLMALGGSLLFDGAGDIVSIIAAAALVTPGLAATLMAAFGLWRAQANPAVA